MKLLSIAQQKHAPTIANAPHEKPVTLPGFHDSSRPPVRMAIIPRKIRRSKFSRNTNQASNAVNTPSRLSNKELLEAGVVVRPTISKTGATTPRREFLRSAMANQSGLARPPLLEHRGAIFESIARALIQRQIQGRAHPPIALEIRRGGEFWPTAHSLRIAELLEEHSELQQKDG